MSDVPFCRVYLVDYGDQYSVPTHELRKIENRFLHLPFQGCSKIVTPVRASPSHILALTELHLVQ